MKGRQQYPNDAAKLLELRKKVAELECRYKGLSRDAPEAFGHAYDVTVVLQALKEIKVRAKRPAEDPDAASATVGARNAGRCEKLLRKCHLMLTPSRTSHALPVERQIIDRVRAMTLQRGANPTFHDVYHDAEIQRVWSNVNTQGEVRTKSEKGLRSLLRGYHLLTRESAETAAQTVVMVRG